MENLDSLVSDGSAASQLHPAISVMDLDCVLAHALSVADVFRDHNVIDGRRCSKTKLDRIARAACGCERSAEPALYFLAKFGGALDVRIGYHSRAVGRLI